MNFVQYTFGEPAGNSSRLKWSWEIIKNQIFNRFLSTNHHVWIFRVLDRTWTAKATELSSCFNIIPRLFTVSEREKPFRPSNDYQQKEWTRHTEKIMWIIHGFMKIHNYMRCNSRFTFLSLPLISNFRWFINTKERMNSWKLYMMEQKWIYDKRMMRITWKIAQRTP